MNQVILIGCGFLGEAAADFFSCGGWEVLGVCRSETSAARLSGGRYSILCRDVRSSFDAAPAWFGADVLVHAVSSGPGGGEAAYRAVYLEGLRNVLAAFRPKRCVFVGSTSVYGQTDGSWVDEESVTKPEREAGRVLLEAEGVALAAGGFVLRLPGLYGPGRSVLRRRFLAGEAVLEGDGGRWINQVHRNDVVCALDHLIRSEARAGVYNVCDNTPATEREVYGWLAAHEGMPLPPSGPVLARRKRAWTNKRVSNARLRATGWEPKFASYREALDTPGEL